MCFTLFTGGRGGLLKVDDGTIQYIGGRNFSLEIDEHMSLDEFRSRVCDLLNMRPKLVKFEFTIKFDPSSLILLCDDASYTSMLDGMMCILRFMYLQLNVYLLTSPNLNL